MKKTGVLYKIIIWLLVITIFNGSLSFTGISKSNVVKAASAATLQQMIIDTPYGGTLYLEDDYYQNPTCSPIKIEINKPIKIIGVPNTYGASPTIKALTFVVDADNVRLENLNFTKHSTYEEEIYNEDRLYRLLFAEKFLDDLTVINCTFSGTTGEYPPIPAVYFGSGGLVYVSSNTSSTFTNCTFKDSIATVRGGHCAAGYCIRSNFYRMRV